MRVNDLGKEKKSTEIYKGRVETGGGGRERGGGGGVVEGRRGRGGGGGEKRRRQFHGNRHTCAEEVVSFTSFPLPQRKP